MGLKPEATMGPNRPVDMRLARKMSPSQGASFSLAPVACSSITSASPSGATGASIVPDDVAIRRLLDEPTQRVGPFVGHRDLWRARHGEILGRDEATPLEGAVAELTSHPARHVLDGRIDVAGRTGVVGENR